MDSSLLSIGDICSETGLSSDVVRVWERRYGFPMPVRLPSGHRRYRTEDLHRLRLIAEAVASGHRPSTAVRSSSAQLQTMVLKNSSSEPSLILDELMLATENANSEKIKNLLAEALFQKGLRDFVIHTIAPLLERVGIAWAEGRLDIHHEKLLTEVLEDLLRKLRNELDQQAKGPREVVLITTLPGERHRLGLLMAALIYTSKGYKTEVLGMDVPVANIAKAARQVGAHKVAVSLSILTAGESIRRLLKDLQERLPQGCALVVGGQGASRTRKVQGIERMTRLEDI
ncbi:HTH-type transcriptional repressor CarH [Acidobacteriota bacterium]|nr:HTH-type transcriptional repressor CarH [Acidobacteriota bacterium]